MSGESILASEERIRQALESNDPLKWGEALAHALRHLEHAVLNAGIDTSGEKSLAKTCARIATVYGFSLPRDLQSHVDVKNRSWHIDLRAKLPTLDQAKLGVEAFLSTRDLIYEHMTLRFRQISNVAHGTREPPLGPTAVLRDRKSIETSSTSDDKITRQEAVTRALQYVEYAAEVSLIPRHQEDSLFAWCKLVGAALNVQLPDALAPHIAVRNRSSHPGPDARPPHKEEARSAIVAYFKFTDAVCGIMLPRYERALANYWKKEAEKAEEQAKAQELQKKKDRQELLRKKRAARVAISEKIAEAEVSIANLTAAAMESRQRAVHMQTSRAAARSRAVLLRTILVIFSIVVAILAGIVLRSKSGQTWSAPTASVTGEAPVSRPPPPELTEQPIHITGGPQFDLDSIPPDRQIREQQESSSRSKPGAGSDAGSGSTGSQPDGADPVRAQEPRPARIVRVRY